MKLLQGTTVKRSAMLVFALSFSGCATKDTTKETTREHEVAPARDKYEFGFHDMERSDVFRPASFPGIPSCLTSTADWNNKAGDDLPPHVEVKFAVEAGLLYRCWAYIGGCCQETMECFYQATDAIHEAKGRRIPLTPGGKTALPLYSRVHGAKRTHAQHDGPKEPSHWTWLPVPLPRYPTSGIKKVRLLALYKGFSVGKIVVTAREWSPKSPLELEPLDKASHITIQRMPLPEELLLAKADLLWKTDDEKAISIYRQLLEAYGDTSTVQIYQTKIRRRAEQGD